VDVLCRLRVPSTLNTCCFQSSPSSPQPTILHQQAMLHACNYTLKAGAAWFRHEERQCEEREEGEERRGRKVDLEVVKPSLEGWVEPEFVNELLEAFLVDLHALLCEAHHVSLALIVLLLEWSDDALKRLAPCPILDLPFPDVILALFEQIYLVLVLLYAIFKFCWGRAGRREAS
jgi:hypothetical protein